MTRGRNVRSNGSCSMCPAIHVNSRSWLRSSSTHEPSDPPPRVSLPFSLPFPTPVLAARRRTRECTIPGTTTHDRAAITRVAQRTAAGARDRSLNLTVVTRQVRRVAQTRDARWPDCSRLLGTHTGMEVFPGARRDVRDRFAVGRERTHTRARLSGAECRTLRAQPFAPSAREPQGSLLSRRIR